jgi:hypothetical protein
MPRKREAIAFAKRVVRGTETSWLGALPPRIRVFKNLYDGRQYVYGAWFSDGVLRESDDPKVIDRLW